MAWGRRRELQAADREPYTALGSRETPGVRGSIVVMQNELVKRLAWSGLVAGLGVVASIAAQRGAAVIWRRVFGEDPPE